MAPKKKFTKQHIIDAAFEIAKVEGLDAITIRKVAQKLGSSIAPIYVNFNDIDELIQEVVMKTFEISKQMLKEQNSGQPFRDIAVAGFRFAKEYRVLYRDLVMKDNPHLKNYEEEFAILIDLMKQDQDLAGFSDEELKQILLKMRIFQAGILVSVVNGSLPDDFNDEKMMMELLDSAAVDVVTAARLRKSGELVDEH